MEKGDVAEVKKPRATIMWMHPRYISKIKVSQRSTGVDTSETYVTFTSDIGEEHRHKWEAFESQKFIDLSIDHNSCARLKDHASREAEKWIAFEKENGEDLAEFERLKKKFSSGGK